MIERLLRHRRDWWDGLLPSSRRPWGFALAGLAAYLLAGLLWLLPGVQQLDWFLLDHYAQRLHGSRQAEIVAVIGIDEALFEAEGVSWPLDKNIYGELLDFLDTLGASAVVIDIVFANDLGACGKGDEIFQAMLDYAPRTVLTFGGLVNDRQSMGASDAVSDLAAVVPERYLLPSDLPIQPGWIGLSGGVMPYPDLLRHAGHLGFNNLKPMTDGIDRRVHLLFAQGARAVPSMALEAARIASGQEPRIEVRNWGRLPLLHLGDKTIPLDREGRIYPSFAETIPLLPLSEIRKAQAAYFRGGDLSSLRKQVQGRVVFIGMSAPSLGDFGVSPTSNFDRYGRSPNVLMHARATEALLHGNALYPWNPSWGWLLSAAVVGLMLLCLGLRLVPARWILALFLLGFPLAYWCGLRAYAVGHLIPLGQMLLTMALMGGFSTLAAYHDRDRDRRFLYSTFKAYLSPAVIDAMAKTRQSPALGGEAVVGTALFTDIEGFSSFSEQLSPSDLVALLNEYFTRMTTILLAHGATVDKFIGDAIVAFFGAPLRSSTHAADACHAALALQRGLTELRQEWSLRPHLPPAVREMKMRIGINTGEFVVGNIGCHLRMNYTMVGDTVNLAARLESAAAKYGVSVLVSGETLAAARTDDSSHWPVRWVDQVRVKGRATSVEVFELDERWRGASALLETCKAAQSAYRAGNFTEALRLWEEIEPQEVNRLVNPSQVLLERCHLLNRQGPDQWDGIWTWTSK